MITIVSVFNLASSSGIREKLTDEETLQFSRMLVGADRESIRNEITKITAELRHLYQNMREGCKDAAQAERLSDGLLSPQIKRLEDMIKEHQ